MYFWGINFIEEITSHYYIEHSFSQHVLSAVFSNLLFIYHLLLVVRKILKNWAVNN